MGEDRRERKIGRKKDRNEGMERWEGKEDGGKARRGERREGKERRKGKEGRKRIGERMEEEGGKER